MYVRTRIGTESTMFYVSERIPIPDLQTRTTSVNNHGVHMKEKGNYPCFLKPTPELGAVRSGEEMVCDSG